MKRYLGDSIIAEIGPHGQIVLTTLNGRVLFLEPRVFAALVEFVKENQK